jgi:structure-specific recognition protein 1
MAWTKAPKGHLLAVERADGAPLSFLGFPDEGAAAALRALGLAPLADEPPALAGHNWGRLALGDASLTFRVAGAPAIRLPLPDVAQAAAGRDDVTLTFPLDDTAGARDDALVEMTFHVPKDCPDFPAAPAAAGGAGGATADGADGEPAPALPACRALLARVAAFTDDAAATGDAIATFDAVGVLVPRGRFDVELFASSLKLVGQAQDFRVQYDSILRVFVLPKVGAAQTLVAICLDPPIRKGQTHYATLLAQFHNDEEVAVELDLTDEALAARNERGAKLARAMAGPAPDVFARVLRGLSGAKLTRPGAFRDAAGDGPAVRCSYKADDGYLYPLERAFFYVQKPPLLLAYDDVAAVEFLRQAAVGVTAAKTFDLAVRTKAGADHLFRGIPRSEWTNLLEWIQAKALRVENFREAARGPGAAPAYAEAGPDAGLGALGAAGELSGGEGGGGGDDEEDEDFAASGSSGSDDDSGSESGGSEGGGGAAAPRPAKKAKVASGVADAPTLPAAKKAAKATAAAKGDKADKPAPKPRKKKDKDAPKKARAAFMWFSQAARAGVVADNPGIAFADVGRRLGDAWKALGEAERAPFAAQAEADKERYRREMGAYEAGKGGGGAGGSAAAAGGAASGAASGGAGASGGGAAAAGGAGDSDFE